MSVILQLKGRWQVSPILSWGRYVHNPQNLHQDESLSCNLKPILQKLSGVIWFVATSHRVALKGFLIQISWNNCPGLRERFTGGLCWPYRGWRIHVGGFPEKSKKYLYIIDTFVSTALKAATSKMSKVLWLSIDLPTRFYFQSILKQIACFKCMAAHPRFEVNTLGSPSGYWDDETSLCPAPHQCQTSPHCSEEPMLHLTRHVAPRLWQILPLEP